MSPRRKLLWQFVPLYVALFLITFAAVCISGQTISSQSDHSQWLNGRMLLFAIGGGLATSAMGFVVIWHIGRSIEKTREGARRFATGDLSFRLDLPPSDELGSLSETLNQMAAQLHERIATINEQRIAQEAILGSMVEGLIAVDHQTSIMQMNQAATQLLGSKPELIIGRRLPEVMRNRELNLLIERTIRDNSPNEGEITFFGSREVSLQVHCTPLRTTESMGTGALIVLNDITRLRKLERIRQDFVANVSHELKTPLTSIKGFVETLQEGALDEPEEARRFCAIIAKQVGRLQAIIEDLLCLSRIEQDDANNNVSMQRHSLRDIIVNAAQLCEVQATGKNISIDISCDEGWTARFNAPLLEQVMVNLIDNAIKYSDSGKSIEIAVSPEEALWKIAVTDHGCGIEQAHLSRIFERFYRVDKARSRKAGGTGLGLAIVKHILTSHGGGINVESKPGTGSVFTVSLPRHADDAC